LFIDISNQTNHADLVIDDSAELLKKLVEARIHQARGISGYLENLFKAPASILSPGPEAAALCKYAYTVFGPSADLNTDKRLVNTGRSVDAMVSSVLGILVASSQSEYSLSPACKIV